MRLGNSAANQKLQYIKRGIALFFLSLLSAFPASGQRFPIQVFNEGNGLPTTTVHSLAQDKDGYLRAACRNGIARYDGRKWRHFSLDDGLETPHFQNIRADLNSEIWAATSAHEYTLARYRDGRWHHIPQKFPIAMLRTFFQFQLLDVDGQTVPTVGLSESGLWLYRNHAWHFEDPKKAVPHRVFHSMSSFRGKIILATDRGPLIYDGKQYDTRYMDQLPEDRKFTLAASFEILPNGNRRLWILGETWLGYLQAGRYVEVDRVPPPVHQSSYTQSKILSDGRNGIFFGTESTLRHYDIQSKQIHELGIQTGFPGDGATALLLDREKILWIASMRGLTRIANRAFSNYYQEDGLLENEVSAAIEWEPGVMLLGHNRGITLWDKDGIRTLPTPNTNNKRGVIRVMDIRHGPENSVLIALSSGGVMRLNRDWTREVFPVPDDVWQMVTIYHDRMRRTLWVGGNSGLFVLEGGAYRTVETPFGTRLYIRRIIPGIDGQLLIPTGRHGLVTYDGDWHQYRGQGLPENNTYSTYQDTSGRIWVGNLRGLFIARDDRLVRSTDSSFFLERSIYFLLGDQQGGLWAGTDSGFFHLQPGKRPRQYSVPQGLPGFETNRAAGLIDHRGNLWVGTDQGLSRFTPSAVPPVPPPPLIGFDGLYINQRRFPTDQPLRLMDWRSDLTFHYRAVTMMDSLGVQFQSRLEGYEDQWSEPFASDDRKARFINLPAGSYRFHIRARLEGESWSNPITTAPVRIPKPVTRQWWFRSLSAAFLLVLIYLGVDYATSKRMSKKLENLVGERTARLEEKIVEHQAAEARYQELNRELDARVRERTAAMEAMQKDLMESAHYAGMAEIATSVLHNVGNILNSISTAGYLLNETLEKSAVSTLERANEILALHVDDFAAFLQNDPRAPNLLKMYLSLGTRFKSENHKLREQLGHLMNRIQTIKDVVSQQHNYTSNVYQSEEVNLEGQIETALTILEEGMAAHGVKVHVQCEEVPLVRVQKTKLIHTLVNILKNAREAVQMTGSQGGSIQVRLYRDKSMVVLSIQDTGIGIEPENLPRIFTHGFTTKKTGHGFGLHSCANAMKEMNGTIEALSEGKGKGATFVLKFPLMVPVESPKAYRSTQAAS